MKIPSSKQAYILDAGLFTGSANDHPRHFLSFQAPSRRFGTCPHTTVAWPCDGLQFCVQYGQHRGGCDQSSRLPEQWERHLEVNDLPRDSTVEFPVNRGQDVELTNKNILRLDIRVI
jgi:hypothetical protein